MIYFYNIHNKGAILDKGLGIESRPGSPACGWDLWTEMMRDSWKGFSKFKPEYFKYFSCVATINCETPAEAFHLTNSEEAFANNYYGKVNPLTATGALPSMSIGDIVLANDEFFMCMGGGWELLEGLTAERAESMKKTEALRNSILEDYELTSIGGIYITKGVGDE